MVILTLIPLLMIPAALGIMVTMGLAYILPAQRGKDMLVVTRVAKIKPVAGS